MRDNHSEYRSYLLRLWRGSAGGVWHASLESTATGQLVQFADLAALIAFLIEHIDEPPGTVLADQSIQKPGG
jgi:hypothetical protein